MQNAAKILTELDKLDKEFKKACRDLEEVLSLKRSKLIDYAQDLAGAAEKEGGDSAAGSKAHEASTKKTGVGPPPLLSHPRNS